MAHLTGILLTTTVAVVTSLPSLAQENTTDAHAYGKAEWMSQSESIDQNKTDSTQRLFRVGAGLTQSLRWPSLTQKLTASTDQTYSSDAQEQDSRATAGVTHQYMVSPRLTLQDGVDGALARFRNRFSQPLSLMENPQSDRFDYYRKAGAQVGLTYELTRNMGATLQESTARYSTMGVSVENTHSAGLTYAHSPSTQSSLQVSLGDLRQEGASTLTTASAGYSISSQTLRQDRLVGNIGVSRVTSNGLGTRSENFGASWEHDDGPMQWGASAARGLAYRDDSSVLTLRDRGTTFFRAVTMPSQGIQGSITLTKERELYGVANTAPLSMRVINGQYVWEVNAKTRGSAGRRTDLVTLGGQWEDSDAGSRSLVRRTVGLGYDAAF